MANRIPMDTVCCETVGAIHWIELKCSQSLSHSSPETKQISLSAPSKMPSVASLSGGQLSSLKRISGKNTSAQTGIALVEVWAN